MIDTLSNDWTRRAFEEWRANQSKQSTVKESSTMTASVTITSTRERLTTDPRIAELERRLSLAECTIQAIGMITDQRAGDDGSARAAIREIAQRLDDYEREVMA